MKGLLEGDEKPKITEDKKKIAGDKPKAVTKDLPTSSEPNLQPSSVVERKPKTRGLGDVLKKLTEDKDTVEKAEKMIAKAPKESKKIARKTTVPAGKAEAAPKKEAKAEAPKKTAEEKAEAPKKAKKDAK
jgi:hypothetical protein